ncbi:hypothetical protein AL036_17980 [Salipiger aestuarii]|uniref:hypothetical protein n=1 Tax=Salipiger aestuarii TaxID=568098 RepID=UPI00123A55A7|nr:hypothetical protein [Salipiger aestuarii]KAA8605639.1 hypothetical protein AL036_17980 [Salipiger aestuarii]
MSNDRIAWLENGQEFNVGFNELLNYHGQGYPGGVAHGLKVMQRAWPLLDDGRLPERREVRCVTAFGGPGGRDAIEFVTRGLTEGRYIVDKSLGEGVEESPGGRYYFRFEYRGTAVEVTIRPGHVRPEFIVLARKQDRTPAEEVTLAAMKREMGDRLLALAAEEIYDAKVSQL